MSKKVSRTYRFSQAALDIIEARNKEKYYHANDFVESRILEADTEKKESKLLKELAEIKSELALIKKLLAGIAQPPKTINKESEYAELPNTNYQL